MQKSIEGAFHKDKVEYLKIHSILNVVMLLMLTCLHLAVGR